MEQLKGKTEQEKFSEKVALSNLKKEKSSTPQGKRSISSPKMNVEFLKKLGYTEKEITKLTGYKIEEGKIKLKNLIKEKINDIIKVKVDTSKYFDGKRNLYDKESIKTIDSILKIKGFKFKGNTPGQYSSPYWYYDGKEYEIGYYRLTGNIQRAYIEMEEIRVR